MRLTYAVTWEEPLGQMHAGKLELRPTCLRLEGGNGATVVREVAYEALSGIRVARALDDRIGGRPTLVLERVGDEPIRIASVAELGIVAELAERIAKLHSWARAELPDDLSFEPTPGAGNSDGGDVYPP